MEQEGYTFTLFHEDKVLKSRSLSPEIKALVLSIYSLSENIIQPAISARLLIVQGFFFVLIYFKRSGFPVTAYPRRRPGAAKNLEIPRRTMRLL